MQCFATGCVNLVDSRTTVTARLVRVRKEYLSQLAAAGGAYKKSWTNGVRTYSATP